MRTFALILLLFPGIVSAQSSIDLQKTATIVLTGLSLERALTILSLSYGVEFSYSDDIVPTQAVVDLSVNNENLTSALNRLLSPYQITYKVGKSRIILQSAPAILTQTIRGTVVDELTQVPVPGATLIIRDTDPLLVSTTSENGKFRIANVPVGRRTLQVSCVGYNATSIANILVGMGKEVVLEVKLSESVTPMDEVIVTALKEDGIPGQGMAVTSSRSFSVEDTRRYAGSMGDPARMASAFAGVTGASDENNALIVRGNSPRGVLWRVEGIEVPNPNHFTSEGSSHGIVSVLSPNMIGTSDLLTGAFPAPYGNALSAVLDMNLRSGNNERREHSIQAGLLGVEASTEGPFSKEHAASYLVNYRYSTLSILDRLGADLNDVGQYKDYQDMAFKIHCSTNGPGTLSVFGIGGMSQSNKADTVLQDNNVSNVGVVGVTYNYRLNESTLFNGALSASGTRIAKYHEIAGLDAGPLTVQENYSKTYMRASLSARKKITSRYYMESGLIVSSLKYDFFLRNLDPGNNAYQEIVNFSEHGNTTIMQGFLSARHYLSSAWSTFYGVHFLHFALTQDQSWEPRVGIRWTFSPRSALSAGYGRHSRIENLQYYLARDHQPGGDEVQINKDLGFTRADHVVLTYEQTLPLNHKFKLETYYQKLQNAPVQTDPSSLYASINEDSGFITDTLANKGSGKNYGVELSFERPFRDHFYFLVNGSLYRSLFQIDNQPQRSTAYNGNYTLHFLAGKEFEVGRSSGRLGLNLKLTQAGGRRYVPIDLEKSKKESAQVYDWGRAFEDQLPGYFRADAQLVYKIDRSRYSFEWRLDIQNLTQHRNASYFYYDDRTESIKLKRQVGVVPLLSCRIEF